MKFLSTFVRTFGVLLIISFSIYCILMGFFTRDMADGDPIKKYLEYISSFEDRFYDYRAKYHLDLETVCDVKLLENIIVSEKIKNLDKLKEVDAGLKEYLAKCDNTHIEEIKSFEIFEDPLYSQLKKDLLDYIKSANNPIVSVNRLKDADLSKNKRYVSDNIVLIEVDDESLAKINSWPIPRENWTTLIDNLGAFNAKVVSFDVLFPEEAKSCGEQSPDDDFAKAIVNFQAKGDKRIIFSYTVQKTDNNQVEFYEEAPGELYLSMVDSRNDNEEANLVANKVEKHTWPIQKLLESEPDLGYLNMQEDGDGVFRHYQLATNIESIIFPSLGLRSFISFTNKTPTVHVNEINANSYLEIDGHQLEINSNGETKLRWIGKFNNYKTISLHKVLYADPKNSSMKKFFDNKIVFIGSSATGAHDFRNTPIDSKLPGVFAHMNFVDMLLQQNYYKPLDDSIVFSFYFLGLSMFVLVVTMLFGSAVLDMLVLIVSLTVMYTIDYKFFIEDGYQIKLFFIFFCNIATYSYVTFLNFNKASAEKKQIKGAFSRYVAPSIVDDMLDNPEKLKIGGEKRDITCMFSDVRDFTSISEKLTPTELAQALNRYMGAMTDIVFETAGTLDKYIGDAIVAFWGAPLDIGDHVNMAMDASVKMMEALPTINDEFAAKGLPEFKIGLGLNSGECSVGNMGSDQIFAYTALGDNMNLGARLESLCKHYGAQILISEYTFERMDQTRFTSRLIDRVKVKGKSEPVGVYEVLYSYHPFMLDLQALEKFKNAFQLFTDGSFKEAKKIFEEILETQIHDKASLRMRETCIKWIENPPAEGEDWTITTMTTKG